MGTYPCRKIALLRLLRLLGISVWVHVVCFYPSAIVTETHHTPQRLEHPDAREDPEKKNGQHFLLPNNKKKGTAFPTVKQNKKTTYA